jgi:hypothetical protein
MRFTLISWASLADHGLSGTKELNMDAQSSNDSLAFWSGWASIVSVVITFISLVLIDSVNSRVKDYKRKARLREVIRDVRSIPVDAIPLSDNSKSKLASLKRNVPARRFDRFTSRGRAAHQLHKSIDKGDLLSVREEIADWISHSEVDL